MGIFLLKAPIDVKYQFQTTITNCKDTHLYWIQDFPYGRHVPDCERMQHLVVFTLCMAKS